MPHTGNVALTQAPAGRQPGGLRGTANNASQKRKQADRDSSEDREAGAGRARSRQRKPPQRRNMLPLILEDASDSSSSDDGNAQVVAGSPKTKMGP
jgi:hypothetical protein